MKIRPLQLEDIDQIIQPAKEMYSEHDLKEPNLFTPNSFKPDRIKKYFANTIDNSKQFTLVAVEKNKVAGFIKCEIKEAPRFYKEKYIGYTDDLVVLKEYRRKGIASKLKIFAERWFKEKGIKLLECKIYEWNTASRKLSEKLGYKKTFSYYYKHLDD